MTDIDDLVTAFIAAEDQNFSLFNFVNELNKDQEKLEEQAAELRAEIARYQGSGSVEHVQRKRILQDLEKQLVKTDANTQQYEKRFQGTQMTFDALKEWHLNTYHKHAKEWAVRSGAITEDIITNFTFVNARLIRVCPTCGTASDTPYEVNQEQEVLNKPCGQCGYHFPVMKNTDNSTALFKDVPVIDE